LGQKTWSKMQYLYFLIAACNLLATAFCLYLSHRVISVYQSSVAETAAFDRQMSISWTIADTAVTAQSEFIKALDTKPVGQAQSIFKSKVGAFRHAMELLTSEISGHFSEIPAQDATRLLGQISAAMTDMENLAQSLTPEGGAGDDPAARQVVSKMTERYVSMRLKIENLIALIEKVRLASTQETGATAANLRNSEFYIGLLMALIVCSGAFYGQFMGRLLKRKFDELEKSNAELEEAHHQALAFSKEIQTVNGDMGTLNRQLNENLSKLREAQDDALRKGKMAQLGNLTATVAHELRNPLSTVRTSTYLLARKVKDKGLGVEPQLQRINNGIIRCDNIITQLLDFSRSKAVKPEPTVLDVWLEKLVQIEAQKLPDMVSIECYFGLGGRLIDLEPGRFERAIINLLSNASEAMVGKGDDPKVRFSDNPVITITTRLAGDGAEIIVADNGPGISAENLSKVREPLFTTKNFGTGLGISAVEQILEQHSGKLDIASIEGQGATFTLWLPIRAQQGEQAA
jgi:signal transduction histidine kinase